MGKLQPAEYYDKVYKDSPEYNKHWSDSTYLSLWEEIIKLIPHKNEFIIDIGCGVGQFGDFLSDRGYKLYIGYDYSEEAIKKASEKGLQCHVRNVLETQVVFGWQLAMALEIFEHTDDFQILRNIPKGVTIIFSVPEFDDPAHIRHFNSAHQVRGRYSPYIEFEHLFKFEKYYIGKGVKK